MIDLTFHYRGIGSEQRPLPALPRRGDYIRGPGASLWVVNALLFSGDTIYVYVVAVGEERAAELERQWATWTDAAVPVPDVVCQQPLFPQVSA